jgi:hypothetical protein
LFYRTSDSSLYLYSGSQWLKQANASGYVPYTGATDTLDMGQFGVKTKFLQFDTSSRAISDRTMQWSNDNGTLQFGMTNGGTITQNIGLQQFARVKNVQGSQINKGQVVYLSGASGDRASVKLADNRQDSTSSKTLGIAVENIAINDVGLIGTFGTMSGFNLSAYSEGDVLYLDSIPGGLTKTKPQAPYHLVFIGVVERNNAGNGLLFTNPQNGYELEELHNVKITSPVRNNAILLYDSVARLWIDTTISQAGLAVTSVATNTGTGITGGTITTSGTLSIDTTVISTRLWRQKGIDSVISVMGSRVNGTTNYVSKFTGTNTIGNSQIFDNGSSVGVGTAVPSASYKLDVNGNVNVSNAVNYSFAGTKYGTTYATNGAMGVEALQGADISLGTGSGAVATERVVIKNGGNVGIGINSPSVKLDVNGAINGVNGFTLNNDSSNLLANIYRETDYSGTMRIYNNGTPKIFLASNGWSAFTGGNLGVGVTNPDSMLTVTQGAYLQRGVRLSGLPTGIGTKELRIDANGVVYANDTLTNDISGSGTTNYLPKFTSSSAIGNSNLQTDASGNLGLGLAPNSWTYRAFQIYGAGLHGNAGQDNDAGLSANAYYSSGWKYYATNSASQYRQVNGEHTWNVAPSGSANSSISFTQAMTLTNAGNLGIGTTSAFNTNGFGRYVNIRGASNAVLYVGKTDLENNALQLGWTATESYLYNITNTPLLFGTNNGTKMTLDASGNLGLGVTPSAMSAVSGIELVQGSQIASRLSAGVPQLYISSNIAGDSYAPTYKVNGYATQYRTQGYDGTHTWWTAPSGTAGNAITFTQAMTLDASGLLNVGGTGGTKRLNVFGDSRILNVAPTLDFTLSTNTAFSHSIVASNYSSSPISSNTLEFRVASGASTQATVMTLNGAGNVGIGTTSPNAPLSLSGSADVGMRIKAGASALSYIDFDEADSGTPNGSIAYNHGTNAMTFATGGSNDEKMRITSGGNVGIGTQSPNSNLEVYTGTGAVFRAIYGADNVIEIGNYKPTPSGAGYQQLNIISSPIVFFTGTAGGGSATERMRITAGGEVYIGNNPADQGAYNLQVNGTGVWGAGAYVDGSDSAVKKNIQPLGASLDIIKQMNPVTFEYQPFYSKDTTTQTGFIAQELQQVLSNKVYKNGIVKEGGQYLGVAYQHLIPLLVKAIQEQQAQIDQLKAQLNK